MTQVASPAAPVRSSAVVDAPDVFAVIRRYIWLILIGTFLGTAIGIALYEYLRIKSPKYTASVTYQVLPQSAGPGRGTGSGEPVFTSTEDIARFIRRQIYYIKSDGVVEQALLKDEFQHDYHDPNSARKSRWYTEHAADTKDAMKKDLEVTAIPSSDMFVVNFTASDPQEAKLLVNTVSRVYLDMLKLDNRTNLAQHLEELGKVVTQQEGEVNRLEQELADYRKSHDVDAIAPRHELEVRTLGDLNSKLVEAESRMNAVKALFDGIKKQVEQGSLGLSNDYQMALENDPQVRNLEGLRLQLVQDLAVSKSQAPTGVAVRALETKLGVLDQQLKDRREELTAKYRVQMQSDAQGLYTQAEASVNYIRTQRDLKDQLVKDLDASLVGAQQRSERTKAQKDILTDLRGEYTREQLRSSTDDSRIRKLGGDAVVPEKPSWPIWYKFWVPAGFLLGLGLSFGTAYLFELTNTRVRTPHDITRALQLPLLGFVPDKEDDVAVTGELSTTIRTAPNSMIAESFRQIRGRLIAQADGTPVKTLLFASIAPGGGATTVASNIANGMALNEMRVLLVDANFYRPGLPGSYKNIPTVGLADVVANPSALDSAIVESEQVPNLHLMGTGNIKTTTAAEMLESRSFREILDKLKMRYDVIIFDGAPLSLVSDSIALGGRVDGVVAVVRAGEVSRGTVARVREQLRHVRARFLGIVLNAAQTHGAGYFKENYRTFYEYAGHGGRGTANAVN